MKYKIGQKYSVTLDIDKKLVQQFADFSGDVNPVHLDDGCARSYGFPGQIAHGAILIALLSKMIGMKIPGPGAVWLDQEVKWLEVILIKDKITMEATIASYSQGVGIIKLDISAHNQRGNIVMTGTATVKEGQQIALVPNKNTKKKIALITGGNKGIGAAISRQLADNNISVAIIYNSDQEAATEVKESIEADNGKAKIYQLDLYNSRDIDKVLSNITNELGGIDIFVHGASPEINSTNVEELSETHFTAFQHIYINSFLKIMQVLLPYMKKKQYGRIITLGTAALKDEPPIGWTAYLAAKHGLWGITRSLARELAPYGITSNMVSPSLTITDLTRNIPLRVKEVEARKNPCRRLATPDDTANVVAFLASDKSSFINGQNIYVTGGSV